MGTNRFDSIVKGKYTSKDTISNPLIHWDHKSNDKAKAARIADGESILNSINFSEVEELELELA